MLHIGVFIFNYIRVQLRHVQNVYPEFNYTFLRRFRSSDDLYVTHQSYNFRQRYSGLTSVQIRNYRRASPYSFVPKLLA